MPHSVLTIVLAGALLWSGSASAQAPPAAANSAALQVAVASQDAGRNTFYHPISKHERVDWLVESAVGPKSLGAGVVSAAWGTAFNNPPEYGPTWRGFAKRYGMRLTGVATGNAIEAGEPSGTRTRATRRLGKAVGSTVSVTRQR